MFYISCNHHKLSSAVAVNFLCLNCRVPATAKSSIIQYMVFSKIDFLSTTSVQPLIFSNGKVCNNWLLLSPPNWHSFKGRQRAHFSQLGMPHFHTNLIICRIFLLSLRIQMTYLRWFGF